MACRTCAPHAGRHAGHSGPRGLSCDDSVCFQDHGVELRRNEHAHDRPRTHVCRWIAGGEPRRSTAAQLGSGARRNVGHAAASARQPKPAPSTTRNSHTCRREHRLPAGNGPFLAYLDVWVRPVDYINDPNLIDKAVGVDSTGRLQTVWQVQLMDLGNSPGATCDSTSPTGRRRLQRDCLTTGTTPTAPSGPCCLTAGAAYTGLENQFYRVEIHQPGTPEGERSATDESRGRALRPSNGRATTVRSSPASPAIANVTNSAGNPASQLTVQSLGRDQVLGFAPGNWIEILDDALEFGRTATASCTRSTPSISRRRPSRWPTTLTRFLDRRPRSDPAHAHPALGPSRAKFMSRMARRSGGTLTRKARPIFLCRHRARR